jgi:glycosyltransferase involved in cell wall biosynthesis
MDLAGEHIGLDAQLLSRREDYRAAGVSHYIDHLLQTLPQVAPYLDFTAYLSFQVRDLPSSLHQSVSRLPTHRPIGRILWEQMVAPWLVRQHGIQLWHALVNVQPLSLSIPSLATIQDLTFVVRPGDFRWPNRAYNRLFVRLTAHRATHILTTSHSTKRDITRCYGLPAAKITVTHLAPAETFRPLEQEKVGDFRAEKGLPDRFILYIGTIEPRKNLGRLIEAFANLVRSEESTHHLVIGGGRGWMYDQVYSQVQTLGLQDRVHFVGFLPQEELIRWYNCADIFVYPSLYEGFGLPPLEAMACGTPVVASDISSLPEIVGDAGILVDPYDVSDIEAGIRRLITQHELYEEKRQAGLNRAGTFSWQRTARETSQVYQKLLSTKESEHV